MDKENHDCKACTKELPELEGINYCPYCGVSLKDTVEKDADFSGKAEEELLVDFVKGKKSLEDIQKAAREKYENILLNTQVKRTEPDDIYSLVLKGCDNKQILVDCLNQVLTRGETAIRLAVTTMPAVLLYKVNNETISTVVTVLKDVDAVFSVIEGGFDYSSFLKSDQFNALESSSKAFLKSIPKTMWLGENIKFISDAVFFEEQKGCGVIGENAFYFFPYDKAANMVLLPLYRLENIDTWELDGRNFAEWISNDGRTYRMEFENEKDIKKLEALIYDGLI